jgi:hypothetical protein
LREAHFLSISRVDGNKKKVRIRMNVVKITKSLVLGVTLLAATAAMAAPENSGKSSVQLDSAVNVNGTQLAPGHYNLKWTTTPSGTELQFINSKKAVTTVPAQIVALDRKESESSIDTARAEDGSMTLTGIRFSGKNFALAIGPTSSSSEPSTSAGQK